MAERRMFAKTIVLSDAFLDMPMSSRCLYFTLGMVADDDGFVNSPKSIMRQVGCSNDDMNLLIAKKFIIAFENGVIVIKHWRLNNYLRSDRYTETEYKEQKAMLETDENGAYKSLGIPPGIPMVYPGKDRIVKDSIEEKKDIPYGISKEKKAFKKPSVEEVKAYCKERNNGIDPELFWDFYESKGWKIGKEPMKDWKSAVRTWEKNKGRTPETKSKASYDISAISSAFEKGDDLA